MTYSIYDSDYFKYPSSKDSDPGVLPRFGLKDTSSDRWTQFWKDIKALNNNEDGSLYKVIFFARHGEAFYNLTINQGDPLTDADGDLTRDDNLIQDGFLQVAKVQDVWKDENSIKDDKGNAVSGIGLPTISYTSPLTRCLVTNSVTFTPFLGADGFKTVVVEDCREIVYKDSSERRRSKTYIGFVFSNFTIEADFAEVDPTWTGTDKESDESVEARVQAVLDKIFITEPKENIFVSLTTHHDIFRNFFLPALGEDKDAEKYHLRYGGVVPIICQYQDSDTTDPDTSEDED